MSSRRQVSMDVSTELKRRLDDDGAPLAKRLCIAESVVRAAYFPVGSKEEIIIQWFINNIIDSGHSDSEFILIMDEFCNCIRSIDNFDRLNATLKYDLIQALVCILDGKFDYFECLLKAVIILFEKQSMAPYFNQNTEYFMKLMSAYFTYVSKVTEKCNDAILSKTDMITTVTQNLLKYYQGYNRKLQFVISATETHLFYSIFIASINGMTNNKINEMFRILLFPHSRKAIYLAYFMSLIRGDDVETLKDKGDQVEVVQATVKAVLNGNLTYMQHFCRVFIDIYRTEPQLIMLLCICVFKSIGVRHSLINTSNILPVRSTGETERNNLLLSIVGYLKQCRIDMNVKFNDVSRDETTVVEVRRSFISFLQNVGLELMTDDSMFNSRGLDVALGLFELDPSILEPKIDVFLPRIMIHKKNDESLRISYTRFLTAIIETVFKLSRGSDFMHKLLPHLKTHLETMNDEQYELKMKKMDYAKKGKSTEKIEQKLLSGEDLIPQSCCKAYGIVCADLLFRKQTDVFTILVTDLDEQCISLLADGFISPSIIISLEVLSSLLVQLMDNCKLAEPIVSKEISEKFWNNFKSFGQESLSKLGESVLRLSHDTKILKSFLNLCHSYGNLKLLNLQYATFCPWDNLGIHKFEDIEAVYDFTVLHSFLSTEKWDKINSRIIQEDEQECSVIMKRLLLQKIVAYNIFPFTDSVKKKARYHCRFLKAHLLNDVQDLLQTFLTDFDMLVVFSNLEQDIAKNVAGAIVEMILKSEQGCSLVILHREFISNNLRLQEAILLRILKTLWELFESSCQNDVASISHILDKHELDLNDIFSNDCEVENYFECLSKININQIDSKNIVNMLNIIKAVNVPYLASNFQLVTLFTILILKNIFYNDKEIIATSNYLMLNIFDLSVRLPELFKVFSVEYLMKFGDGCIWDTLMRGMTDYCHIFECVLKSMIKAIKFEAMPIQTAVKSLIASQKSENGNLRDPTPFEVICILVPLVSKEKKQAGNSEQRSVLSECEEKLHKALLKRMKRFKVNEELSAVHLNVLEAYSIVLSKYGEGKVEEHKSGFITLTSNLEYFISLMLKCLKDPASLTRHIMSSLHVIMAIFKNKHNLATHSLFEKSSSFIKDVWAAIKIRLNLVFIETTCHVDLKHDSLFEQLGTVVRYVFEQSEVGHFAGQIMKDVSDLSVLKKPSSIADSNTALRNIYAVKYLWYNLAKCVLKAGKQQTFQKALTKYCRDFDSWLRNSLSSEKGNEENTIDEDEDRGQMRAIIETKVDPKVVQTARACMEIITDFITTRKVDLPPLTLDYIFRAPQSFRTLLISNIHSMIAPINVFRDLHECITNLLNALLMNRSELLEDRWPCFLQIYRMLLQSICLRCSLKELLDESEERCLSRLALNLEKMTLTMTKRKFMLSRLSAYLVADYAAHLEKHPPPPLVRQHLENCAVSLIQNSDNSYTMPFLNRALAGNHGQVALNNLYMTL